MCRGSGSPLTSVSRSLMLSEATVNQPQLQEVPEVFQVGGTGWQCRGDLGLKLGIVGTRDGRRTEHPMQAPPPPPEASLLHRARESAEITMAEAAKTAGITDTRWSQIE